MSFRLPCRIVSVAVCVILVSLVTLIPIRCEAAVTRESADSVRFSNGVIGLRLPRSFEFQEAVTLGLSSWKHVPLQQERRRWLATVAVYAWITTLISVLTTTVYLHRCVAHGALRLHPVVAWLFRLALWLTTGERVLRWVAIHRKHHAHTDRPGDPHSPVLEGFWNIQLLNVFYYFREAGRIEWIRYAGDVYRNEDMWDKLLFNYGFGGLALGLGGLCALIGPSAGIAAGLLHSVTFVFVLAPLINALCHHEHPTGYQYSAASHGATTYNNWVVAALTMGEGLHHNHHWQPQAARFAHAWWEPDAGWWCIRLLEKAGLASDVVRRRKR